MPAPQKLLAWSPESTAALAAWTARAHALGIDITAPRFGGARVPSDSAAVREALRHATACRCGEDPTEPAPVDTCGACIDAPHPGPYVAPGVDPAERNPLYGMRKAAKLSQAAAAHLLSITRGAYANAEGRASCTPAMLARAREAFAPAPSSPRSSKSSPPSTSTLRAPRPERSRGPR